MEFFYRVLEKIGIKNKNKKKAKIIENPEKSREDIIKEFVENFKGIIPQLDIDIEYARSFEARVNIPDTLLRSFKTYIDKEPKYKKNIILKTNEYLSAYNYILALIHTRDEMKSAYDEECKNKNIDLKICQKSFENLKKEIKAAKEKFYNERSESYKTIKDILKLDIHKNCIIEKLEKEFINHFNIHKLKPAENFKKLIKTESLFEFHELKKNILEKAENEYKSEIEKLEDKTVKNENWLRQSYQSLILGKFNFIKFEDLNNRTSKLLEGKERDTITSNHALAFNIHNLFDKIYNVSWDHLEFLKLLDEEGKNEINGGVLSFKELIKKFFDIYPITDKPKTEDPDEMINYFAGWSDEAQDLYKIMDDVGYDI